ncbi:hypothetical protein [Mycobacterium intracellulare]|nr:hypothetical protein [Mycobacterium intracellulare]
MRAVKTSAKLEERVVPPGHQRSAAAKAKAAVAPTATGVALSLLREAFGPSR